MNTRFNCPLCNAAAEADASNAGMAGDCPACGELLIIPAPKAPIPPPPRRSAPLTVRPPRDSWEYSPPLATPKATAPSHSTITPIARPQPTKHAEDYAADAICATAKGAWKLTKVVAPIVGRITAKVAGRAATAAAPYVEKAAIGAGKAVKKSWDETPNKGMRIGYTIWRLLGGG